jgi:hypothetical protein
MIFMDVFERCENGRKQVPCSSTWQCRNKMQHILTSGLKKINLLSKVRYGKPRHVLLCKFGQLTKRKISENLKLKWRSSMSYKIQCILILLRRWLTEVSLIIWPFCQDKCAECQCQFVLWTWFNVCMNRKQTKQRQKKHRQQKQSKVVQILLNNWCVNHLSFYCIGLHLGILFFFF